MFYSCQIMPEETQDLVDYFNQSFTSIEHTDVFSQGNILIFQKVPHLLPPEIWNVHKSPLFNNK